MSTPIESNKSILYISRLPRDFDDNAAYEFFKQFDEIEGICFPRNKKTGWSKGYMFIKLRSPEVALECQKEFDGYLMFNK